MLCRHNANLNKAINFNDEIWENYMQRCNYCKQMRILLESGRCHKCKDVGKDLGHGLAQRYENQRKRNDDN